MISVYARCMYRVVVISKDKENEEKLPFTQLSYYVVFFASMNTYHVNSSRNCDDAVDQGGQRRKVMLVVSAFSRLLAI